MSHIGTYIKNDGTVVQAHENKVFRQPWWKNHPTLAKLMPKMHEPPPSAKKPFYPNARIHPNLNDKGHPVIVNEPSKATGPETHDDPAAIATFLPGGKTPASLNGVPFTPWADAPTTAEDWDVVEGQNFDVDEPEFSPTKEAAAGVVIEEEDGRVWVIHPTNQFGGYQGTFPKGHVEDGINLQASAIKEAFEETGLKVEITGFLMDAERTTTTCRYYTARRVGGTPRAAGWESQAVSLVPRSKLYGELNRSTDYPMAEALGAGPAPAPPKSAWADWHPKGPNAAKLQQGQQAPPLGWDDDDVL